MNNTRKYQAHHVIYDLSQRCTVSAKSEDTVTFDSEAEYKCYLALCEMFPVEDWNIAIHHLVQASTVKWQIDFIITPNTLTLKLMRKLRNLAHAINGIDAGIPPTHLLIEYKGIKDKSFVEKMSALKLNHSSIANRLLLISQYDDAFGVYDSSCRIFRTHPIIGINNLKQLWETINNGNY